MKRALRRFKTAVWKIKRKDHFGAKCNRARCGICSPHKRFPKDSSHFNKNEILFQESLQQIPEGIKDHEERHEA